MPRPYDATEEKTYDRGKKKRPMLKNIRLINAAWRVLFLRETYPSRVHDKRITGTRPYPLPAGSQLLQDLGFQTSMRDGVESIQATQKPRGKMLTRSQTVGNRKLSRRRVRIEHVNSRVKRCHMLQETIRLWRGGIHDMVMEIGCVRHNLRVRMTSS